MKTPALTTLLAFALHFSAPHQAVGAVNQWTKPTSGYWEEQAFWSLGILPDATQDVLFTNANWKALIIGTNTTQNFPQSMHVNSLYVGAPVDSYNTLVMNFSGLAQPLVTGSLTIDSNGAVVMQSAALEDSGNLLVGGTFSQNDFSQVKIGGLLSVGLNGNGAYFLTNGTLNVGGADHEVAEYISGGFQGHGQFVQSGGSHNARSIEVSINGEFDLYGGDVTATNGLTVGISDYANYASFYQNGGNVNADTTINGNYFLNGGEITGHMQVVSPTFQRVDAFVWQNGGTNAAASLDLGNPNRFGGRAFYVLSNGVVNVAASTTFRGGEFSQHNGRHTIASNLVLQGTDLGFSFGYARADYFLWGGTLSASGLTIQASTLWQEGGTNSIAGNIQITGDAPHSLEPPQSPQYNLSGGFLSASNVLVSPFFGGFKQTGGTNQIAGALSLQSTNIAGFQYVLDGGTLVVQDISINSRAAFMHANGAIVHAGRLTLENGGWFAATGDHSLGPLQLTAGQANDSVIHFPNGASILRLANSSAQPWDASAILYITNWHGAATGGGNTQLFFGSHASGLTPQQLATIKFNFSGELSTARILATGEVVPQTSPLTFTSSQDALILSWSGDSQLFSATNLSGPYFPISGATTPFTNMFMGPQRYFRLESPTP